MFSWNFITVNHIPAYPNYILQAFNSGINAAFKDNVNIFRLEMEILFVYFLNYFLLIYILLYYQCVFFSYSWFSSIVSL